jgi:hypothetical protein
MAIYKKQFYFRCNLFFMCLHSSNPKSDKELANHKFYHVFKNVSDRKNK